VKIGAADRREDSEVLTDVGPRAALLGTVNTWGVPTGRMWGDPVTENIPLNTTQTWEIYNFTADAHPIHLHQVAFQVVNRQALLSDEEGIAISPAQVQGAAFGPEREKRGSKIP
jgi:bilirubin oxidase